MEANKNSWATDLVGHVLGGRYRLERLIAVGGMGAVFLARHQGLGTYVAAKLLLPRLLGDPVTVQRFLLEARTAASVGRRGVVEILDLDIDNEHGPFLAMELLSGQTLGQRLKEPMELEEAATIVLRILETLAVVHEKGIIHRDIKPGNVFLADDPDLGRVVKLLDFGIARVREAHEDQVRLTRVGVMIGTPRFMAPEQALTREVDARTDLYAVGLILYCCLGNVVPYKGLNHQALLNELATNPPRPVRELRPGLPEAIYRAIDKALERDPKKRFQSADEMHAAIKAACGRADTQTLFAAVNYAPRPDTKLVPETRGYAALTASPSRVREPRPTAPPKKKKSKLALVLGVIVATVALLVAIGAGFAATQYALDPDRVTLALGGCPEAPSGSRAVCGDGFLVEVPAHYEDAAPTVPGMVGAWVDRTDGADVPINVTLVRQAYSGSTAEWSAAGLRAMAGRAEVLEQGAARNGERDSVEVYARYDGSPPYREVSRALAHGGHGWVLRCQGSTRGDFTERLAVCRRILSSFRLTD